MAAPAWGDVAGSAYRGLIDDQLKREDERKTSFESRGLSIITSAGTLVALVFAFSTLVTNSKTFTLDDTTKILLAVSLSLLVLAAAAGIVVTIPAGYGEAQADDLRRLLDDRFWLGRVAVGQKRVAEAEIGQLVFNRRSNNWKGSLLVAALVLEVLGILVVAIAVLLILT